MTQKVHQPQYGPSAILTPANVITIIRLLVAPFVLWLIIDQHYGWAVWVLWIVITASDSLDGYLARKQGTTRSGAFLDPLADKFLALGGLWAVVIAGRSWWWWIPVALMTLREVIISVFRWYWGRRGLSVQASKVAKFKTFLQFNVVGWAVLPITTDWNLVVNAILIVATAVTWVSALQYITAGSRATTEMS